MPGNHRTYELHERPGLACLDARLRAGSDWCFGRRWVRTHANQRELFRLVDRVEALGFRFRTGGETGRPATKDEVAKIEGESLDLRASLLLAGLTAEERRVHAELFPDEHALLSNGYDWDGRHVYRRGQALDRDPFGRVLDVEGGVLYEWVHVRDEFTWRRYPLERVRPTLTARGT